MDLTSIAHQQLLQQLARTNHTNSWLDTNKLPNGSRLIATVETVARVDPSLQQRLLTITDTTPNISTEAKQNARTLIQQSELYIARLTTLGKKLTAFTNLELRPKQQVPVLIKKDGQLFIEAPKNLPMPQSQIKTNEQLTLKQDINKTQNSSLLTHINEVKSSQKNIINNSLNTQQSTLTNGLKQYLPIQKKMAEVFSTLNQLAKMQDAKATKKDLDFLSPITTKILPLLNKAPQISQFNTPQTLAAQIKNSGIFFEQKIATLHANQNDIKNNMLELRNIIEDDVKADTLRTIHALNQLSGTLNTHTHKSHPVPNSAFDKLMQSVFNISATPNTSKITWQFAQKQLIDKLHPLLFANLARLTTMQVQHLMNRQLESPLLNNGGLFEFPVRINDEFFPLTLNIQERFYQEKQQKNDAGENQKVTTVQKKRWHVFMEFDLQELGSFASDILVDDHTVKTTLWIEKEALWIKSKLGLELLQEEMGKSGITVEDIQCIQGSPPEKPVQLHHTLIDVKT